VTPATWWLDVYFRLFGYQVLVASVAAGIMTYLAGLMIALAINFVDVYVTTPPVYLGLVGIMWTCAFVGWGRMRINDLLNEIEPVFRANGTYVEAAAKWERRLLDWRPQAAFSVLSFVGSSLFVWYATHAQEFPWFPPPWSRGPDLWQKNVIVYVYAAPILVLLGSALGFIAAFTTFVLSLRKLKAVPVLPAALAMLRPVAGYGLTLSIGWSGGISIFIVFFRLSPTIGTVLVVGGLSGIAFVILFSPQYAIHRVISETKRSILEAGALKLAGDVTYGKDGLDDFLSRLAKEDGQDLVKVLEAVSLSRTWVYAYTALVPLVAPVGLPLGVLVLRAILGR
jgi:hypothetical protein